jgi:NAD(P)-dependent dehydrogenase (short-subunit alcohol dehydrogenase family)
MKKALVFGGSGAVGGAVLRELHRHDVKAVFTYLHSEERARELAQLGHEAVRLDLEDADAVRRFCEALPPQDIFIHCAAKSRMRPLSEITDEDWRSAMAVGGTAPFVAVRALAPRMTSGQIVFVGALDRGQSLPLPVHYAASQGLLSAMVMALAKELGPRGICVNLVALGLLDGGMGRAVDPKLREQYQSFSGLRRVGSPDEAARAIVWLALENTFMTGKVLPVNGGL